MHYIGQEEIDAVANVIKSKQFMRYRGGEGGHTENFETALAEKTGAKKALAVNSGTSALIASLVGLGIGPGDEVIVPAYTWVASALAPLAVGAVPVLAEINESLTIDIDDIEKNITPYTKAIIPVHMRNLQCDMQTIMNLAEKYNLKVLEDACQAVGASYKGRKLGSIGNAGAFSFNMFKNITCGEGGALITNEESVYARASIYHDIGSYTRANASEMNELFFAGVNYRVSEIQGAILEVQLKRLDSFIDGLRERVELAKSVLRESDKFKISPHNDTENAVSISLLFEDKSSAKNFSEEYETGCLINAGRHIYSNWDPLMKQHVFHEKMNPYKWSNREINYSTDMCPVTLDILSRTCVVDFAYDMPMKELEIKVKKMAE